MQLTKLMSIPCWSFLYICIVLILCSSAGSLHLHLILHEWLNSFSSCVFKCPPKWCTYSYSTGMAGATWNCCHLSMFCVHHVTSCKATCIHKVHAYLLYLHATLVTWGCNGYQNKTTESWLWRRKFCFCRDWNPWPFWLSVTSPVL